jgi:hypothetical protein
MRISGLVGMCRFSLFTRVNARAWYYSLPENKVVTSSEDTAKSGVGLKDLLENVSKIITSLVVTCYLIGFVIIITLNQKYGVANFNFLRVRVIAAGVLFVALTCVPVMLWAGIFGSDIAARVLSLFGREFTASAHRPLRWALRAPLFVSAAKFLSVYCSQALHVNDDQAFLLAAIRLAFLGFVVCGMIFVLSKVYPHSSHWLILVFVVMFSAAEIYFYTRYGPDRLFYYFMTWGVLVLLTKYLLSQSHRFVGAQWLLIVVMFLLIPFVFSEEIYSRIPLGMLGGQPKTVTLQFSDGAPFDPDKKKVEVLLLDEEDAGFYILPSDSRASAAFIPRSRVEAMYFTVKPLPPVATKAEIK